MRFDAAFILFFISLSSIAIVHQLAMVHYLYWLFPWFDILMHFLGGFTIGVGTQSFLFRKLSPIRVETLWMCVGIVFAVAVSWEIFEWWFELTDMTEYVSDTLSDLLLGVLGGIVGYRIGASYKEYL